MHRSRHKKPALNEHQLCTPAYQNHGVVYRGIPIAAIEDSVAVDVPPGCIHPDYEWTWNGRIRPNKNFLHAILAKSPLLASACSTESNLFVGRRTKPAKAQSLIEYEAAHDGYANSLCRQMVLEQNFNRSSALRVVVLCFDSHTRKAGMASGLPCLTYPACTLLDTASGQREGERERERARQSGGLSGLCYAIVFLLRRLL